VLLTNVAWFLQSAVREGLMQSPIGYKITFRRLQQAVDTSVKLVKQGHSVVPSVIWGLLRSYTSTFKQQDQQLWLKQLSMSCAHISHADPSCFALVTHVASDALPWVHSAKQLESELSVLEVFAAETAASALLLCKASDRAGHAASLLIKALQGMYPERSDAVASLESAVRAAKASADIKQLHVAFEQSSLVTTRDLKQVWQNNQGLARIRATCQTLQQ